MKDLINDSDDENINNKKEFSVKRLNSSFSGENEDSDRGCVNFCNG